MELSDDKSSFATNDTSYSQSLKITYALPVSNGQNLQNVFNSNLRNQEITTHS